MRAPVGTLLVGCLVLAGCSEVGDDEAAATSTPPLVLQTAEPTADPGDVDGDPDAASTTEPAAEEIDLAEVITDPELRTEVEWVLGLIDPDGEGPAAPEAVERFAPAFLEEVPLFQLATVFGQLRAAGPYAVTQAAQSDGVGRSATLSLHAPDQPLVMTLALDDAGQIAALAFQPDTSGEMPTLESWADLDEALAELGGQSQVVVGRVDGGACEVVHTTAGLPSGGEPAPSASVVKLLVLSAVAEAVRAGDLAWEQELTITPESKSLPSGTLQDREDGSSVSVQEAAELMISISDNTATDLLIGEVGQGALREAALRAGVDPVRVMPIPTTRQLFQLGWQVDQEVRTRWAETQVPETREAILADLPDELDVDPVAVTQPRWEDDVDWLLTGEEICGLHAVLQQQAGEATGAPVREILAANPGIEAADGVDYQGFKGGSAPGVLALSFYTEVGDTDQVLVIQTRSSGAIDQLRAVTLARAALQHLATSEG